MSDETLWVLGMSVMTRGITDVGIAAGAAAALALGAWRVSHGLMSLEALLIVLMAGTEIFRPLRDLRTVLHQGMNGQSAAQGVHALLGAMESAPTGSEMVSAETRRRPSIVFEDVRFAYPGVRGAALEGLTFAVGAGERVGIVGPSGAGKSSIVRLLLRLYDPQHGNVRIGDHDLRELDPEDLRRHIAVVAQDTYLFHGTVEDNLRLGRPDATAGRAASGGAGGERARLHPGAARRLPDRHRRARDAPFGRPAPAPRDRARAAASMRRS